MAAAANEFPWESAEESHGAAASRVSRRARPARFNYCEAAIIRASRFSLRWALVVVAALLVMGLWAGRHWVNQIATSRVRSQLVRLNGGPVTLGRVSVGLRSLSVADVGLLAAGGEVETAWCSIGRLWLNLSFWDGLRGDMTAERAVLDEVQVQLRFSQDGTLLTRFPNLQTGLQLPVSVAEIRHGSLTLQQAGRPQFTVSGVKATVRQLADTLLVRGNTTQPCFHGDWSFEASGAADGSAFRGDIAGRSLQMTDSEFSSLPLLPRFAEAPKDFVVEGSLSASLDATATAWSYQAECNLSRAAARLLEDEVEVVVTAGLVAVQDGELTATDIQGSAADGEFFLSGKFDLSTLRGEGHGTFKNVASTALPGRWHVPEQVSALLAGSFQADARRESDRWYFAGNIDSVAENVAAFGVSPEVVEVRINFSSSHDGASKLPLGVDGLARIHVGLNSLDVATISAAAQQLRTWQPSLFGTLNSMPDELRDEWEASVSGLADVEVPLATFDRWDSFRGEARLMDSYLTWRNLRLSDAAATIALHDGELAFTNAVATIYDAQGGEAGRIIGQGVIDRADPVSLAITAELQSVPLTLAADVLEPSTALPKGLCNLSLEAKAPLQELAQLTAWRGHGKFDSPLVTSGPQQLSSLAAEWELQEGRIQFRNAEAKLAGAQLTGGGQLDFSSPYPFRFRGALEQTSVETLTRQLTTTPVAIAGSVAATGTLAGTLAPLAWSGNGVGSFRELKLAGEDLGPSRFTWHVAEERTEIRDWQLSLSEGTAELRASFPFDAESSSLQGTLTNFNLATLPWLPRELPVTPAGNLSAEVRLLNWHRPPATTGTIRFATEQLRLDEAVLTDLSGQVEIADARCTIEAQASLLTGQIRVAGITPVVAVMAVIGQDAPDSTPEDAFHGTIQLHQIPLNQLPTDQLARAAKSIAGHADAKLQVRLDADWNPQAEGEISIHDVRWQRQPWSQELRGRVTTSGNVLRLNQLTGDFARGRLRGNGEFAVGNRLDGNFQLSLDGVDAGRAMVPWPALASQIDGLLDLRLQGVVGSQWRGRGQVSMHRGTLLTMPITRLRVPLDWTFVPRAARLRLRASDARAQVARGQLAGLLDVSWGSQLDLNANLRGSDIELRSLLRDVPGVGSLGSGRVSGRAQFSGRRIRSLNDFTGRMEADLSRLQPFQFPVLRQVRRFLQPVQPTTTFDSATAKLRLANGMVHLEKTTIEGGVAQLFIEGSTTLRGKLDLDVTAQTGDLADAPLSLMGLIRSPLGLAAPIPLGLLAEANQFLSDRLVYLHIGGTIRRPAVRPQPARQLQQEAIQFFLRRAANAVIGG